VVVQVVGRRSPPWSVHERHYPAGPASSERFVSRGLGWSLCSESKKLRSVATRRCRVASVWKTLTSTGTRQWGAVRPGLVCGQ
jgi:hypothetical protein